MNDRFSLPASCPKCGTRTDWGEPRYRSSDPPKIKTFGVASEWLDFTCDYCGYQLARPCAGATPEMEAWGVFSCQADRANVYDLQGIFTTKDLAIDGVREIMLNRHEWHVLSTGLHWFHPEGTLFRVSRILFNRWRDRPEDSDPPGLRAEIDAILFGARR